MLLGGLAATVSAQEIRVSGEIRGADGEHAAMAHVELLGYEGWTPLAPPLVAASGRYELTLPAPGLYRLAFSAPLHGRFAVAILADEATPVALDVQLRRLYLDPDQSFTRVVAAHDAFDYDAGTVLEGTPEAGYRATVAAPSDTLIYRLPGATIQQYAGLVFGELTADGYRYLGRGEYDFVLATPADSAAIRLQPRRLDSEEPPAPVATFGPENRRQAAFWAFYRELHEDPFRHMRLFLAQTSRDNVATVDREEAERLDAERREARRQMVQALAAEARSAPDVLGRQLKLLMLLNRTANLPGYVSTGSLRRFQIFELERLVVPEGVVAQVMDEIPPDAWLWRAVPVLVQELAEQGHMRPEVVAYAERIAAEHPSEEVRRTVAYNLAEAFLAREGRSERSETYARRFFDRFTSDDPGLPIDFERQRPLRPGQRAPRLGQMSWERTLPLAADSLKDRVVLVDFSTTACADCRADYDVLERLEAAHDDLRIVRVVLDFVERGAAPSALPEGPGAAMYTEDGYMSRAAQLFGVLAVPQRVLIDRDGVVIAVGAELFGERLETTLERSFGR